MLGKNFSLVLIHLYVLKSLAAKIDKEDNIFSLNYDELTNTTESDLINMSSLYSPTPSPLAATTHIPMSISSLAPTSSTAPMIKSKEIKTGKVTKTPKEKKDKRKCNGKKSKGNKKKISDDVNVLNCTDDIIPASLTAVPTLLMNETAITLLPAEYEESESNATLTNTANQQISTSDTLEYASVSTIQALRTSLILVCAMFVALLLFKQRRAFTSDKSLSYVGTDDEGNVNNDTLHLEDNDIILTRNVNANNVEKVEDIEDEETNVVGEESSVKYLYISHDARQDVTNDGNALSNRDVSDLTHGTDHMTPGLGIQPNPMKRMKNRKHVLKVNPENKLEKVVYVHVDEMDNTVYF